MTATKRSQETATSVNTLAKMLTICMNELTLQNKLPRVHSLLSPTTIYTHMHESTMARSHTAKFRMK